MWIKIAAKCFAEEICVGGKGGLGGIGGGKREKVGLGVKGDWVVSAVMGETVVLVVKVDMVVLVVRGETVGLVPKIDTLASKIFPTDASRYNLDSILHSPLMPLDTIWTVSRFPH